MKDFFQLTLSIATRWRLAGALDANGNAPGRDGAVETSERR